MGDTRQDGEKNSASSLPRGWPQETRRVNVVTPDGEQPKEITYYKNSLGMEFVLIPAGEFMMGRGQSVQEVVQLGGAEPGSYGDEQPQHRVLITKPYHLGAYEVTQAEYEQVTGENPARFRGPGNPVERVSWDNAVAFCKRLSQRDDVAYRLPTEAEWECACRAGSRTPFYTGQTISTDQANYDGDHTFGNGQRGVDRKTTMPAGSFAPNAFGLYGMHGNVWEWCQSLYKAYPYRSDDGREDIGATGNRVLRGGSWFNRPTYVRSANRDDEDPSKTQRISGFRVCANLKESF